jgi:hypothetical protein
MSTTNGSAVDKTKIKCPMKRKPKTVKSSGGATHNDTNSIKLQHKSRITHAKSAPPMAQQWTKQKYMPDEAETKDSELLQRCDAKQYKRPLARQWPVLIHNAVEAHNEVYALATTVTMRLPQAARVYDVSADPEIKSSGLRQVTTVMIAQLNTNTLQ